MFLDHNILHILIYYVAIFIITPERSPLYPLIIWFGMFIFSIIFILFYYDKNSASKFNITTRIPYKKIHKLTLTSSFLFLITCISYTISNHLDADIPITLTIVTLTVVIYTIISHIKSIDNKNKKLIKKATLTMKYSWLFISIISYFLARSIISTTWDIPFEHTSNKLTTIATSLLFGVVLYYLIYFISLATLLFPYKKKRGEHKFNTKLSEPLSIIAPLFTIGYVSYIAFTINTLPILTFGFEKSITYDTRDTFYCNNEYMMLNDSPDARFLFVSNGNYRAVIPRKNDYYISRLSCTTQKPFYLLTEVQNKKDLRKSILKQKIENIRSDTDAIASDR